MRKLFALILVLCAFATPALPANTPYQGGQVFVSLSGVAATGAGTGAIFSVAQFQGSYPNIFSWQMSYTGTPTSITAVIEGSLDGTVWATLDTSTNTAGELRYVSAKSARFVRCNITAYTVNGSTATCKFTAGR